MDDLHGDQINRRESLCAENAALREIAAENEVLRAEVSRLEGLILDWVDRYERVEKSDEYRSVWEMAQIHQGPYRGEQWLEALRPLQAEARRISAQREEGR